ncbi:sigma factor G inhibitor Gin [Clostridium hydrogeniformans]|uniref:sigma factor G inhibitor Gin n=1 Tax=Clostridium hydrogeniformans TaxID=349933 RepID=UPI0004813BC5|nr:sigma factor G inhibitor Gin [Clostridium hydrogeniformans]
MGKNLCILCRKPLTDGIIVNGRCICSKCEIKIVNLKYYNTDFYNYYKDRIKKHIAIRYLNKETSIKEISK